MINGVFNILRSGSFSDFFTAAGYAFARRKKLRLSETFLSAAYHMRPKETSFTYSLASLRVRLGKIKGAVKLFSQDLALLTGDGTLTYTRALCFDGKSKMPRKRCVELTVPSIKSRAVYFVAGDAIYFKRYALALANSISRNAGEEIHLHMHVINPCQSSRAIAKELASSNRTISFETTDLSGLSEVQMRTYYSCARYLLLSRLLTEYKTSIIVADFDQMIINDIGPLIETARHCDFSVLQFDGLGDNIFAYISATALVINNTIGGRRFAELLEANTESAVSDDSKLVWHLDQGILAISRYSDRSYKCGKIPPSMIHLDECEPSKNSGGIILWSITNSLDRELNKLKTERFLDLAS